MDPVVGPIHPIVRVGVRSPVDAGHRPLVACISAVFTNPAPLALCVGPLLSPLDRRQRGLEAQAPPGVVLGRLVVRPDHEPRRCRGGGVGFDDMVKPVAAQNNVSSGLASDFEVELRQA